MVPQPQGSKLPRFGLFPVRSPLLGESRLISFPPGTEMFQFPGLAPFRVTDLAARRVAPFGHPGITARMQLPQAYRSLPRPSSPLDAKASTVCLIAFDLKFWNSSLMIPHPLPSLSCQRAVNVSGKYRVRATSEIFRSGTPLQVRQDLLESPERR